VDVTDDNDDGEWEFQSVTNTKRGSNQKRLYIGNLPRDISKEEILELLQQPHESSGYTIEIVRLKQNSRAFVGGLEPEQGESLISSLDQTEQFEQHPRTLAVQWEQVKPKKQQRQAPPKPAPRRGGGKQQYSKQRKGKGKNNTNPFGSNTKSWSKPTESAEIPNDTPPPASLEEASERIESIVSSELSSANNGATEDEALSSLLAATAAVSLVAEGGFNVVDPSSSMINQEPLETSKSSTNDSFSFDSKQPLSSLLAEYGDFDPNWQKQQVPITATMQPEEEGGEAPTAVDNEPQPQSTKYESRLGIHGKAPLHVDFCTFGYHYGVPAEVRSKGWSHSQPLTVMDCREFPTIPSHLAWQDGVSSGLVKRLLVELSHGKLRTFATQTVAPQVATALVEAANVGGYGYAQPLSMVVHVASDYGKHRSVVAAELAAAGLRKLLRANENGKFQYPISVGTRHRDIAKTAAGTRKKRKDDDDDD